jgi:hypothetical protein
MLKIRPTDDVPFERKTLHLKQVRFANLDEIEQIALTFFSPGYSEGTGFRRYQPTKDSPLHVGVERGFEFIRDENQARRFAGDFSLPRSRYHTVCLDNSGRDGGLLINEVKTYSKPQESGHVHVFDSTSGEPRVETLKDKLNYHGPALFFMPEESGHFPNPIRQIIDRDGALRGSQLAFIVPLSVGTVDFERLIDLRMPATQDWFVKAFTRLENDSPSMPVFASKGPLDDFEALLPTLLAQELGGGNGATQIAGAWLRCLGADAAVFPSARADLHVTIEDGLLTDWYGWNLVDYRSAPPPTLQAFVDFSPEWDRRPTAHADLLNPAGNNGSPQQYTHVSVTREHTGRNAGSLQVQGVETARSLYHDFALWTYFTGNMEEDLGHELINITFLLASDGNRRVYIDQVVGVARTFMLAIHGSGQAKHALRAASADPRLAGEVADAGRTLVRFFALCDPD